MSKRKKRRSQPNLPQETLARARREAGLEEVEAAAPEPEEVEEEEDFEEEEVVAPVKPKAKSAAPAAQAARARQETLPPAQRRKRTRTLKPEEMTQVEIANLLAHPTKEVDLEKLKEQYAYVIGDLRSMGGLAAVLVVVMILAARFLYTPVTVNGLRLHSLFC